MARRIPPMNALRAFEAAGRHGSFTRAAEELFVTPGAISRQITGLEDYLGVPLFNRNHREVKLTNESREYLTVLTNVFEQIERGTKRLLEVKFEHHLHIRCSLTLTLRWLVPRLLRFHALHPKQQIRLTTTLPIAPADVTAGAIDVAFITGTGDWPDMVAHRLVEIELMPVCSPKLLAGGRPLRSVADLEHLSLLHSLQRPNDWSNWLKSMNATALDPYGGLSFESSSLAYQAAIEGIGVAMAQRVLVQDDIAAGRLIAPFDSTVKDGTAFHLIYPVAEAENPRIVEFRDWIIDDVAQYKDGAQRA